MGASCTKQPKAAQYTVENGHTDGLSETNLRIRTGAVDEEPRPSKVVNFLTGPQEERTYRPSNARISNMNMDDRASGSVEFLDGHFTGVEILRPIHSGVLGAAFVCLYKSELHVLRMRALDFPTLSAAELLISLQTIMSEPSFTSNPNLVTIHAVRLEAWGAEEDGRKVHQRIKGWTTSPSWFVPNLHRGLHQLWTIEDACEYGSLRFQVDRFSFMKMSGRPNMLLVIQAASEIARAMECLHLSGKVHGRLSSSTVFLQRKLAEEGAALSSPYLPDSRVASSHAGSATSRASLDQDRAQSAVMWQSVVTGYINESFLQQASTGTDSLRVDLFGSNEMTSVAHLAPEVLINGQATQATDVYAFSIILWELATQKHVPFRGMSPLDVRLAVVRDGSRPSFPSTVQEDYVRLASQCWAQAPGSRPTFSEIRLRLQNIHARFLEIEQKEALQRGEGGERRRRSSLVAYNNLAPKYASYFEKLIKA